MHPFHTVAVDFSDTSAVTIDAALDLARGGDRRRFILACGADRVLGQASCPVMLVPHRSLA